jgi:hypothetical protein
MAFLLALHVYGQDNGKFWMQDFNEFAFEIFAVKSLTLMAYTIGKLISQSKLIDLLL